MSISEKPKKRNKGLTERQLRQSGALPDSCAERVSRVCLGCGTVVADIAAWHSCGRRCEACDGPDFRAECTRCRGACPEQPDGRRRSCASVAVFRATGRVAFPERAVEPSAARRTPATPVVEPTVRPAPEGPSVEDLVNRAGWWLGAIAGTAAGLCRRWLDGLGIK